MSSKYHHGMNTSHGLLKTTKNTSVGEKHVAANRSYGHFKENINAT